MISTTDTSATVKFTESGMMEVRRRRRGLHRHRRAGRQYPRASAGETVFTCYDATPRTINITFGEESRMNSAVCLLERSCGLYPDNKAVSDAEP